METSAKEGINTRELFINCSIILYEENRNLIEQIGSIENSSESDSLRFSLKKKKIMKILINVIVDIFY